MERADRVERLEDERCLRAEGCVIDVAPFEV